MAEAETETIFCFHHGGLVFRRLLFFPVLEYGTMIAESFKFPIDKTSLRHLSNAGIPS